METFSELNPEREKVMGVVIINIKNLRRKESAKITLKAININGERVAEANVPVSMFKRKYGHINFSNSERIFFTPVKKESRISFVEIFYEGILKRVIKINNIVTVPPDGILIFDRGDLNLL